MTEEYAPGRLVDVVGSGPTVVLWHGAATDDRTSLTVLAAAIADHGRRVVVPDWDSATDDLGRADLFASLRFAQETADDPERLTLVGWSLGGIAAASLTLQQPHLALRLDRTVCVAAAPFPRVDPLTHSRLGAVTPPVQRTTSVAFVHGTHDPLMSTDDARRTRDEWLAAGWPTTLLELDADHFTIVSDHARQVAGVVVGA